MKCSKFFYALGSLAIVTLVTSCDFNDNLHVHNWSEEINYTWNEDNTKCVAKRVCLDDESHIETEEADISIVVSQTKSCTDDEIKVYTAKFENSVFETQNKKVVSKASGHNWGEATYAWSDDYSECVAKRVCLNDETHIESETQKSVANLTRSRSCTGDELTSYEVSFENKAFAPQIKSNIETNDELGHNWSEVTYTWNEDNTKCSATRVCLNDESHVETEEADVVKEVKAATCSEGETTKYSVAFTNEAFLPQTKEEETAQALGHNWSEVTYTWNEENTKCSATRVCLNDESHVETEETDVVKEVKAATCSEGETTKYSVAFTNEAFLPQTKEEKTAQALGHNWSEVTYTWNEENTKCSATRVCLNDESHVETEEADVVKEVKAATCSEGETTKYSVAFTNEAFLPQTKEEETAQALGHVKSSYELDKTNNKYQYTCSTCNEKFDGTYEDVETTGQYKGFSSAFEVTPGNAYYYHSEKSLRANYGRFKVTEATAMTIDIANIDNAVNVIATIQLWNDESKEAVYSNDRGTFQKKYSNIVTANLSDDGKIVKQINFNFTEEQVGKYIVIDFHCGSSPISLLVNYGYLKPEETIEYPQLNYMETKTITLSGNYSENPANSPDIYKFVADSTKKYSITLTGDLTIYRMIKGKIDTNAILSEQRVVEFEATKDEEFIFVFVAPVEEAYTFEITIGDELPKVLSVGNDVYFSINEGTDNYATIILGDDVLAGHYKLSCEVGSPACARANILITLNDEQIYYSALPFLEENETIPTLTFKAGDVIKIYGNNIMLIDGTLKLIPVDSTEA